MNPLLEELQKDQFVSYMYTEVGMIKGASVWLYKGQIHGCFEFMELLNMVCLGRGRTFRATEDAEINPYGFFPGIGKTNSMFSLNKETGLCSLCEGLKHFDLAVYKESCLRSYRGSSTGSYYFVDVDSSLLKWNPHVLEFWNRYREAVGHSEGMKEESTIEFNL